MTKDYYVTAAVKKGPHANVDCLILIRVPGARAVWITCFAKPIRALARSPRHSNVFAGITVREADRRPKDP